MRSRSLKQVFFLTYSTKILESFTENSVNWTKKWVHNHFGNDDLKQRGGTRRRTYVFLSSVFDVVNSQKKRLVEYFQLQSEISGLLFLPNNCSQRRQSLTDNLSSMSWKVNFCIIFAMFLCLEVVGLVCEVMNSNEDRTFGLWSIFEEFSLSYHLADVLPHISDSCRIYVASWNLLRDRCFVFPIVVEDW